MTRTSEEITAEILQRVDLENKCGRQKWERLKTAMFSFAFLVAAAALAFTPWSISLREAPVAATQAALIFEGAGGYVLTGVICFASGGAIALACVKSNELKSKGGTQK